MARWVLDDASVVRFVARSSLHPIRGWAERVSGEVIVQVDGEGLQLDPAPTAYVEVAAQDLVCGNSLQEAEMRRRIRAKRHPTIRWDLTDARGGPERFEVAGEVTLNGVTRSVRERVTVTLADPDTLRIQGAHEFDITTFDVTPPRILALRVHDTVHVEADLVARRA